MNYFANVHPAVIFTYFMTSMVMIILFFDPIILGIYLLSQILFISYCKGILQGVKYVLGSLGFVMLCGGINAFVNHRGATVFARVAGLPITLESVVFGGLTGVLLAASLLLFSCYNNIMTSEKMMCLFGNVLPQFSLVFSMILRLVPKLKRDYHKIRENQKIQTGMLSALVGIALEDSLETGVVMRYRGYGSGKKRTSIYSRKMKVVDWILLGVFVIGAVLGVVLYMSSGTTMEIFPYIEYQLDNRGMISYGIFFCIANLPMWMNGMEEIKWRRIVSNI